MRDEGNRTTSSAPLARPPGRECWRIFNRTNRSRSTCALGAVAAMTRHVTPARLRRYETARKERARGRFVVPRARSICEMRKMTANFRAARSHARLVINFVRGFSESSSNQAIGRIFLFFQFRHSLLRTSRRKTRIIAPRGVGKNTNQKNKIHGSLVSCGIRIN